jgi:hypothetical protein
LPDLTGRLRTGDAMIAEEHDRLVGSAFTRQLDGHIAWLVRSSPVWT